MLNEPVHGSLRCFLAPKPRAIESKWLAVEKVKS